MHTREKGRQGEDVAMRYLENKGYKLTARNYYCRGGEVDLIMWDERNKELVFVEVKARQNRKYGYPEDAVDSKKVGRIVMAGEKYLNESGYKGRWRVDCVALEMNYVTRRAKVVHYVNI